MARTDCGVTRASDTDGSTPIKPARYVWSRGLRLITVPSNWPVPEEHSGNVATATARVPITNTAPCPPPLHAGWARVGLPANWLASVVLNPPVMTGVAPVGLA